MRNSTHAICHQRRAITLIETVISLSIMSILLLGLSGAVMISSKAIPTATQTGIEDQIVIDAFNQFRSDIRQAMSIEYVSSGSEIKLSLIIKDSGAKGNPEAIRYRYIVASHSFTRMVKDRTEEILIDNITSFAIQFDEEDTDATTARVVIVAYDTMQDFFELYIALPDKPEMI